MEHYIGENKWCVYYHKNKIDGKYYVGITKNTKNRWQSSHYKKNPHFWRAIQKYGWNDFDHVILFTDLPKKQAIEIEIYLIAKFDLRNPNKGYNITKGGEGGALQGAKNPNSRPIYQYSLNGDYIKRWDTITEAAKEYQLSTGNITHAAINKYGMRQTGGYQWSYEKVNKMEQITGRLGGSIVEYPRIYKVGFDGKIEEIYDDVHCMDGFTDRQREHIIDCCRGNRLSSHGSIWMFETDYNEENVNKRILEKTRPIIKAGSKMICMYNKNTGKLIKIFQSRNIAARQTNLKHDGITMACNNYTNNHVYRGYLFYYYDETHGQDVSPWKDTKLRPILRFHDGKFMERFSSLKEARAKHSDRILNALYKNKISSQGDRWLYEDQYLALKDELCLEEIDLTNLGARSASCTE